MSRARDAALAAAAALFSERGYSQVTIRDIAALAELSPAMVMKCVGNKQELFLEVATVEPLPLPACPSSDLGQALVRDIFDRFYADTVEPMTRAIMLRLTAPDHQSVIQHFTSGYVDPLTERLGGDVDARLRAELAVSALVGFATMLRIFGADACSQRSDEVVRRYGKLVQHLLDS
ncbi:hypothetical protein OPAG_05014 [Rhodococcus opacus PD630]|uniref:TetR/AcrR family transcriptional regulator n=1 Tax=Rhodococcus opacus TaxID=37919 RepID=UPI00029CC87D|nr:TetR/AcrR family transcriptional regulator [Rhodococcus opacus]AHK31672.1 hypothetical protein Pd630_LPD04459 [Rhodococcus opacus PD630]EHI44985.1 hypothetical protein OPAG_05014 [Rhodococcus opacus PD630]UDG94204.1 TetR family transcriptional regulator [Rhodococcus opacus PD630]